MSDLFHLSAAHLDDGRIKFVLTKHWFYKEERLLRWSNRGVSNDEGSLLQRVQRAFAIYDMPGAEDLPIHWVSEPELEQRWEGAK